MSKLNICLISMEYPPDTENGGIGTYTYHLACGLSKLGHEVSVISKAPQKEENYFEGGVNVYRILDKKIFLRGFPKVANYFSGEFFSTYWHSRSVFSKVKELSKNKGFDVIECPLWAGESLAYSKSIGVPLVVRLQTPYFKYRQILNLPPKKSIERIEKLSLQKATIVASISKNIGRLILQKYQIEKKKIIHSPLGIPFAPISQSVFSKNSYKLLFVSRLEKRKGIKDLIDALPKILTGNQKITVDIVGKDINDAPGGKSYFDYFQEKVPKKLQERVKFWGFVRERKLAIFYRNCDLFIMPSRYESFGLVYLEAMAWGKPVIGTKVGGIPEIIKDGQVGFLVEINSPQQIAKAVLKIFSSENLRRNLGQGALKLVREKFSCENMVSKTINLYNKAIKKYEKSK